MGFADKTTLLTFLDKEDDGTARKADFCNTGRFFNARDCLCTVEKACVVALCEKSAAASTQRAEQMFKVVILLILEWIRRESMDTVAPHEHPQQNYEQL